LIDDLITRGTSEPYRMFTSRAEYRLLLREDNADLRLTPHGRELGLVDAHRWKLFSDKQSAIVHEQQRLQALLLRPDSGPGAVLSARLEKPLAREQRAHELLRRPDVRYADLMAIGGIGPGVTDARVAEQVEIQARYSGYLERQQVEIVRQHRYQEQALPADFDYNAVRGLSNEVCEKLQVVRPQTIGQASRIPGITPAAVSLLLIYLRKRGHTGCQSA
jgi:tRNA uridine 5-carboxymethylaminomethyl modification enzyme